MTNRKKQLTELAQRVMDGCNRVHYDLVHYLDRPDLPVLSACEGDLSAIKSLEQELLDSTDFDVEKSGESYTVYIYASFVKATAPTEQAARLAALLLALAEEEE